MEARVHYTNLDKSEEGSLGLDAFQNRIDQGQNLLVTGLDAPQDHMVKYQSLLNEELSVGTVTVESFNQMVADGQVWTIDTVVEPKLEGEVRVHFQDLETGKLKSLRMTDYTRSLLSGNLLMVLEVEASENAKVQYSSLDKGDSAGGTVSVSTFNTMLENSGGESWEVLSVAA